MKTRFRRAWLLAVVPVLALAALAQPAAAAQSRTYTGKLNDGLYTRGDMTLQIWDDGSYQWRGHLHNNGVLTYRVKVLCVTKTADGAGFAFYHEGRVKGDIDTIFGGNKKHDWVKEGSSNIIRNNFNQTLNTGSCRVTSGSVTFQQLLGDLQKALNIAGGIKALFA